METAGTKFVACVANQRGKLLEIKGIVSILIIYFYIDNKNYLC